MSNRFFRKILLLLFFLIFTTPLLIAEDDPDENEVASDAETVLVEEPPVDQLANEGESTVDIPLPEITIAEVTKEYADIIYDPDEDAELSQMLSEYYDDADENEDSTDSGLSSPPEFADAYIYAVDAPLYVDEDESPIALSSGSTSDENESAIAVEYPEAVEPIESETVAPAEPMESIEMVESIEPEAIALAEPTESIEPEIVASVEQAEPIETIEPVESETVAPAEPTEPIEAVEPIEPEAIAPSEPMESIEPEIVTSVESTEPIEAVETIEPEAVASTEFAEPVEFETTASVEQAEPIEAVEPIEPEAVASVEPIEPATSEEHDSSDYQPDAPFFDFSIFDNIDDADYVATSVHGAMSEETQEIAPAAVSENETTEQQQFFDFSIFDNIDDADYVATSVQNAPSQPSVETFYFEIPSLDDLDDVNSMPVSPQTVATSEPQPAVESNGDGNIGDEALATADAHDTSATSASSLSLPIDFLSGQSTIYYDSTEFSQPIKLTFGDGKTITLMRDESKRPKLKRTNPIFEWYLAAGMSVSRGTSYGYAGHFGLNFNISDDFTSGLYLHGEMLKEPLGSSSGMLAGFEVEADFGGNFTFPMFYGGPVAVKVGADFGYYMQLLQFNSSISSQTHLGYNGMVIRPMLVFEFFRLLSSPIGFIFYYTNTAIVPYADYNNLGLMVVI